MCKCMSVIAGCAFLFIAAWHRRVNSITKVVLSETVVNGHAPHEYGPGSLKNEMQVDAFR